MKLYRRRQEILGELGKLDLEIQERQNQKRRLIRQEELIWLDASEMTPTRMPVRACEIVSPVLGFDIYNMHMFMLEIAPGGEGGRYHRHGDAIKHYLSGRGIEIIGEEEYQVEAGDFIHIPANVWHGTQNPYDEPCRILAVEQYPGTYTQIPAPYLDEVNLED